MGGIPLGGQPGLTDKARQRQVSICELFYPKSFDLGAEKRRTELNEVAQVFSQEKHPWQVAMESPIPFVSSLLVHRALN